MSTDINQALSSRQPDQGDDVAVARGYLAAALERCDPDDVVALDICGVWSALDELGRLPHQLRRDVAPEASVLTCLTRAYDALRAAVHDVEPAARALTTAWVARDLGDLIVVIDEDPTAPARGLS